MKRLLLILAVILLSGCAGLYIEKHLSIEGDKITCPYGKGDKVKITRDVYISYAAPQTTDKK